MKVDFIIGTKVSEQDFESKVYDWLSEGDYTPNDIIEEIITEHNLMWFPTHLYKCNYTGQVSAKLGYTREVKYQVYNPNFKRYDTHTHTKTVTDWIPYSSQVLGEVETVTYVGEAKYEFLRQFIEGTGWSKDDLNNLAMDAGKHHKFLKLYKKNIAEAWNDIGIHQCYLKATESIKKDLPSRLISNFKANINFTIYNQISVVVPFWVFMYEYKGKPYYVSVDANNPHRIDGIRPENKVRKYTVLGIRWLGWGATTYLAWIGAASYLEKYENGGYSDFIVIGLFILILGILGFIVEQIIKNIKTESKQLRQKKLDEIRKSQNLIEKK